MGSFGEYYMGFGKQKTDINMPGMLKGSSSELWCSEGRRCASETPQSHGLLLHSDSRDLTSPSTLGRRKHKRHVTDNKIWRLISRGGGDDDDDSDESRSDVKRWSRLSNARDSILLHKEHSTSSSTAKTTMHWLSFGGFTHHGHHNSGRKADDRSATPRGRSRLLPNRSVTPPRSKSPDRLDGTVPCLFGVANQSVRDSSPSSAASTHKSGRSIENGAGARRDNASSRSPHSLEDRRGRTVHPNCGNRRGETNDDDRMPSHGTAYFLDS